MHPLKDLNETIFYYKLVKIVCLFKTVIGMSSMLLWRRTTQQARGSKLKRA